MITIEQRGKNLIKVAPSQNSQFTTISHNTIIINGDIYYASYNILSGKIENSNRTQQLLKPNTIYTLSYTQSNLPSTVIVQIEILVKNRLRIQPLYIHSSPYSFTTAPSAYSFDLMLYNTDHTIINNGILATLQLEEGSVATPYEDPWVNTLNFDEALMSGEQIQQDGNKFYLINNWHRTNTDPYETVTFSGGTATLSESFKENSSIVVDIDTGEVKNSLNSGTTVQVYLNQYDSWTTDNATTTAFNLTKVSLTNDYPVAVDGNVTTSGFTQSTTQIVFDNPVASGSSVSCVYPYLDMNYNSQAKVFYKKTSTSRDEVTYTGFPFELTDGINHIAIQDQLPAQLDVEADDVDTAQSISFPTDLTVNEEDVLKETDTKDHRRNSLRLSRKVTGSIARLQDSTFLEDFKDVQFRIHYHNSSTDGILLDEYLLHAEFTKNSSNLLAKDLADSRDFVAEKKVIQHA